MNGNGFLQAAACGVAFGLATHLISGPPPIAALTDNAVMAQQPPSAPEDYIPNDNPDDPENYTPPPTPPTPVQVMPKVFTHETLTSVSKEDVGTRLVCLFDVSASIDATEYEVQLESMAAAIGSQDFQDAIFFKGGPESVAICVVDFGDTAGLRIGWVDIRKGDEAKLKLLANEIRHLTRRESGNTNHGSAMEVALACLENCPWKAKRSIVDLITDGKHNSGPEPQPFIKKLTAEGATVNALITLDNEADIEEWMRKNILTPPGVRKADGTPLEPGFVKVVATQKSATNPGAIVEYRKAMELAFRRKLILEVAGLDIEKAPDWRKLGEEGARGLIVVPLLAVPMLVPSPSPGG